MNRRQISPLRLRPNRIDVDVNRIVNHAAKLVIEYNQMKINNIMESDKDNQEKVKELLKLSKVRLPRLTGHSRHKRTKESKATKKSPKKKVLKREEETMVSYGKKNNTPDSQSVNDSNRQDVQLTGRSYDSGNSDEEDEAEEEDEVEEPAVPVESDSNVNKTERSDKKSSLTNITRPKSKGSLHYSAEVFEGDKTHSTRTMDDVMTLQSESSLSDEEENLVDKAEEVEKIIDNRFIYDIEIKTGEDPNKSLIRDIFLLINGVKMTTTEKLDLKQYFMPDSGSDIPFQVGNLDKFQISLPDYIGSLKNIVIGLTSPTEDDSWFLEYVSVKDRKSSKEYHFPCRRWLGPNSPDKLVELTLGYSPSYKIDYQSTRSTSLEDAKNTNQIAKQSSTASASNHNSTKNEIGKMETLTRSESSNSKSNLSTESDKIPEKDSSKSSAPKDKKSDNQGSILFGKSIHSAVITNDYDRVKQLCSFYDALKFSEDEKGNTPIHLSAIHFEDSEIMNYLISLTVDPNLKSEAGYTPFMLAVINGNLDSVKYLNENIKVDIDLRDKEGNTPLHLATLNGHIHIVQYLLSEGAKTSVTNQLSETPLDIAQRNRNHTLINMFSKTKEVESSSSSEYVSDDEDVVVRKVSSAKVYKDSSLPVHEVSLQKEQSEDPQLKTASKDSKSVSLDSISDHADKMVNNALKKAAEEHLIINSNIVIEKERDNNTGYDKDPKCGLDGDSVTILGHRDNITINNDQILSQQNAFEYEEEKHSDVSDSNDTVVSKSVESESASVKNENEENKPNSPQNDNENIREIKKENETSLYTGASFSLVSGSTNANIESEDADALKKMTEKDRIDGKAEGNKTEREDRSLNEAIEFDEDHRGIVYDKTFPDAQGKRKHSKVNVVNLGNVQYNEDMSSASLMSDNPTSSVSSRASSSLSSGASDSSVERQRNPAISDNVEFQRKGTDNEEDGVAEPLEPTKNEEELDRLSELKGAGTIDETEEKNVVDNDSRPSSSDSETNHEVESPRIREINKGPRTKHSI